MTNYNKPNFPPGEHQLLIVKAQIKDVNGKIKIVHRDPNGVYKDVYWSFYPGVQQVADYFKGVTGSSNAYPKREELCSLEGKTIIGSIKPGKQGFVNLIANTVRLAEVDWETSGSGVIEAKGLCPILKRECPVNRLETSAPQPNFISKKGRGNDAR